MPAAKVRHIIYLRVKQVNGIRWSSAIHMLQGYIAVEEHIQSLGIPDVEKLRLSYTELKNIKSLRKKLAKVDSVTEAIQNQSTIISKTRTLLDAGIVKHGSKSK